MKKSILILLLCAAVLSFSAVPARQALPPKADCSSNPVVTTLLNRLDLASYLNLIKSLAGEIPVSINGVPGQAISTRFAPAMASNQANARTIPWLLEQLNRWLQPGQINQESFDFLFLGTTYTTQNLVVTFPGTLHPEEVILLTAHMDSTSTNPWVAAPGAEDNASGSAALLEAVRSLRYYRFDRTLKLVWFNAEEQGLFGSQAYIQAHPTENIIGVVNLDMFGFDYNQDRCFELHVGTLPRSDAVGQCFKETISANSLPLMYDYVTQGAVEASDHSSFWNVGVGAVEVLENHFNQQQTGGCVGADASPYYHKTNDYSAFLYLPATFDIARAGIATAANLAGGVGDCYDAPPTLSSRGLPGALWLDWDAAPGAAYYRLERSTTGCSGSFTELGTPTSPTWLDSDIQPGATYAYRLQVFADGGRGYCISEPLCVEITAPQDFIFLPILTR